jgi:hypothetical protein
MRGARIILSGFARGCSIRDLITIAAIMEIPMKTWQTDRADRAKKSTELVGPAKTPRGELLDALLTYDAFDAAAHAEYSVLEEWCATKNLSLKAMLDIVERREEVAAELYAAGMSITWGDQYRLISATKDVEIRAAKLCQCIYDGLRTFLLTYDAAADVYRDRFAQAVSVPAYWRPKPPSLLVTSGLSLGHFAKVGALSAGPTSPVACPDAGFLRPQEHATPVYGQVKETSPIQAQKMLESYERLCLASFTAPSDDEEASPSSPQ